MGLTNKIAVAAGFKLPDREFDDGAFNRNDAGAHYNWRGIAHDMTSPGWGLSW